MPVSDQHKDYAKNIYHIHLLRDCDEGAHAIKSRRGASSTGTGQLRALPGAIYLPPPNPDDNSIENRERYESYRQRASFVNFTGTTKEGMLGMVFRNETTVELDPAIAYLKENADGQGLSLDQVTKAVAADTLLIGRYGLLTDYPAAPRGLTSAQSAGYQAKILSYPAESIINWRLETREGKKQLSMVVLREPTQKLLEDGFGVTELMYHRVLLLVDGVYTQRLYDESDRLVGTVQGEEFIEDIVPRRADGSTFSYIPFTFVGSINNDSVVDKSPLYDIAEINVSHYCNSADYEDSSHFVGQPTPVFSGLTQSWVNDNMKKGIALGSRSAVPLPVGATAQLLQAAANQMPLKGMEIKEAQMINIGARMIQDRAGVETAEAAKIRFAGQNSKLSSIIVNVEAAMLVCCRWAMEFMGGTQEPEIDINREFYDASIDPQLIMAAIQLTDRGVIALTDLRGIVRRAGLIDSERTDDKLDADAEIVDVTL
jgi:hypothetical protein